MCVRSLRTQQRTDSQCQFCLVLGFVAACVVVVGFGVWAFVLLYKFSSWFARVCACDRASAFGGRFSFLLIGHAAFGGVRGYRHSMESLILAQDERWRRA